MSGWTQTSSTLTVREGISIAHIGLTLLLPFILTTRSQWSKCQLRILTLASAKGELEQEQRKYEYNTFTYPLLSRLVLDGCVHFPAVTCYQHGSVVAQIPDWLQRRDRDPRREEESFWGDKQGILQPSRALRKRWRYTPPVSLSFPFNFLNFFFWNPSLRYAFHGHCHNKSIHSENVFLKREGKMFFLEGHGSVCQRM